VEQHQPSQKSVTYRDFEAVIVPRRCEVPNGDAHCDGHRHDGNDDEVARRFDRLLLVLDEVLADGLLLLATAVRVRPHAHVVIRRKGALALARAIVEAHREAFHGKPTSIDSRAKMSPTFSRSSEPRGQSNENNVTNGIVRLLGQAHPKWGKDIYSFY
jgi:hypothetical protein